MRATTLLLLTLVLIVCATTVTFQPDAAVGKDTITWQLYPNSSFGTFEALEVGILTDPNDKIAGFIEFTELNDAQYQGITVSSASFQLYAYTVASSEQYLFGPCDAPWEENTITWNNMVGTHETVQLTYPPSAGWITYDVTTWVQNWLDGTWDNNGLCLIDTTGTNQYICARSSDYTTDPSLRPKLVLEYYGAAVEEATWGEIKATF